MKIALVTDYFYPYTPGGAEWSVYELAKSLKVSKINTVVITVNYGSSPMENYHGVNILRMWFMKKAKSPRSVVNPIWQNNPLFFVASAYLLYKLFKAEKPDVIHVNGKFLIPGAIIAARLTKTPVIVTVRDKQILCPIGKCFFDTKRFKACGFWEYLTSDFPWFVSNYTNKTLLAILYALCGVTWSRFAGKIIKFFARRANTITTISNSQKKYLETNGFENVQIIYNSANFKIPKTSISKTKSVLFVGKLSKGKGVELLLDAVKDILKKEKVIFYFAGSLQSAQIEKRLREKIFMSKVVLLGNISYHDLPVFYRKASVVVMPSIYPEAFGRSALEALASGTPVVVTNTGALPEIIEDRVTGRISEVSATNLAEAILDVIKNEQKYRNNIKDHYFNLQRKFMLRPIRQYRLLYRKLMK